MLIAAVALAFVLMAVLVCGMVWGISEIGQSIEDDRTTGKEDR